MHHNTLLKLIHKCNLGVKSEISKPRFPKNYLNLKKGTLGVIATALLVSACSSNEEEIPVGQIGNVKGFYGGVVADEPNAVLVGRDVLTAGGGAVDAAVAMAFAQSVTYPTRMGLGGGGVCLIHDGAIGLTEAIDFSGKPGSMEGAKRPTSVPAMVRGMAAMHVRYGILDWRQLVGPAEQLARYGLKMSRATREDMKYGLSELSKIPEFAEVFLDGDGNLKAEGSEATQIKLAAVLSQIRARGAGVMYSGAFAKQLALSIQEAGGNVTEQDLRDYLPSWRGVIAVDGPLHSAYLAEPPAGGGSVIADALARLQFEDRYDDAPSEEKVHMLIEAVQGAYRAQQAYMARGWEIKLSKEELLAEERIANEVEGYKSDQITVRGAENVKFAENPFSTGFVVVDKSGS
ncbi:MAG: gamma-glutamyltransferase, partial [Alphaproteobacteria bacterium]|nr:gamma-glutamyltransferase [Alphaproteobacteria bacterium]